MVREIRQYKCRSPLYRVASGAVGCVRFQGTLLTLVRSALYASLGLLEGESAVMYIDELARIKVLCVVDAVRFDCDQQEGTHESEQGWVQGGII